MTINVDLSQITPSGDGKYYEAFPAGDANVSFGNAALGGSYTNDTITITTDGTYDLTTKTNAKPMYFWDGNDNSLLSSPLSRRSFDFTSISQGSLDTTDKLPNSAAAYKYTSVQWPSEANGSMSGALFTDLDGAGSLINVFAKRKSSFDGSEANAEQVRLGGTSWNVKSWRWWYDRTNSLSKQKDLVIAIGQTADTHGNPRITPEQTGTTSFFAGSVSNPDYFGTDKNWVTDFITIENGTADTVDATIRWMANGQTYSYTFQSATTAKPENYNEFRFPQMQFLANELDFYWSFDCFYLDDTGHMVIISDSSTWTESTSATSNMEICIPTAWSGTSITAVPRKGQFASLSGKYLYVLDSSGTPVSTTGVQL